MEAGSEQGWLDMHRLIVQDPLRAAVLTAALVSALVAALLQAARPAAAAAGTTYPVPAGAVHVSPAGNDAGSGTAGQPYRTLKRAVGAAPAGATIVLRGGDYREQVGTVAKRLTLQPYPGESVWIKGSLVVSGWIKQGSVWKASGWTANVPRGGCPPATLDKAANPAACDSDMVFVDGRPLAQVRTLAEVSGGRFFVDQGPDAIYIGDNPGGKVVEASAYEQALELAPAAAGSIVRGLNFAHYSPPYQKAILRINADRVLFENNVVTRSAMFGLSVAGDDVTLRANTVSENGLVGVAGSDPGNLLIEGNTFARNNTERFSTGWEAAGVKLVHTRALVVRDNVFADNLGKGFWCDGYCFDTTFVRNVVSGNHSGFSYEISHKAIVASNLFVNNSKRGVKVGNSSDVRVLSNTFVGHEITVLVLQDDRAGKPSPADTELGITAVVDNVSVANNLMTNGTSAFLLTSEAARTRSGNDLLEDLDRNGYYRAVASKPPGVARWARVGANYEVFKTVPAFRTGTSNEPNGIGIDNVPANPFFANEAAGDYRLKAGSVARGAGRRLPADVAGAIGVNADAGRDLGAIRWPGRPT